MDQSQAIIREKVLRFYKSVEKLFPIKKVFLYGSYAKDLANEHSDIDVAVVIGEPIIRSVSRLPPNYSANC